MTTNISFDVFVATQRKLSAGVQGTEPTCIYCGCCKNKKKVLKICRLLMLRNHISRIPGLYGSAACVRGGGGQPQLTLHLMAASGSPVKHLRGSSLHRHVGMVHIALFLPLSLPLSLSPHILPHIITA